MRNSTIQIILSLLFLLAVGCQNQKKQNAGLATDKDEFPAEMVSFKAYETNPVFSGTGSDTWDTHIRERGYILMEDNIYKMWYSGYKGADSDPKYLGYATSTDGIYWKRYSDTPIFDETWTEDMFVTKINDQYYMYAEGENDIAHLLTSSDGIHWQEQGSLVIRQTNGDIIPAPYGTPTV